MFLKLMFLGCQVETEIWQSLHLDLDTQTLQGCDGVWTAEIDDLYSSIWLLNVNDIGIHDWLALTRSDLMKLRTIDERDEAVKMGQVDQRDTSF